MSYESSSKKRNEKTCLSSLFDVANFLYHLFFLSFFLFFYLSQAIEEEKNRKKNKESKKEKKKEKKTKKRKRKRKPTGSKKKRKTFPYRLLVCSRASNQIKHHEYKPLHNY